MDEIKNMAINDMAGVEFECSCGKRHKLNINYISIGKGVINDLAKIAEPFKSKKIYVVSDDNTYEAAGKESVSILKNNGYEIKSFIFKTGKEILIPDEKAIGRLFMELEAGTGLIVSVGSGTLNDMAKYLSARTGIPYIIVCTAPSMDGYASDGAPLICDGFKISYIATLPFAIIGDTDIMKNAPMNLIHAGYGDILGKLTALADWYLSRDITGEYCCETCVTLVKKALDNCIQSAEGIKQRDESAILYLIEALTLTGAAMGLIGVSRPASGSEHLLSHFWEMTFIAEGRYPELHGIKVGIATPIVAEVFELLGEKIPLSARELCPNRNYIESLLLVAGARTMPTEIGISKELFYKSMMEAFKTRERYSVFRYADSLNLLESCAKTITNRIYGEK